MKTYDVLFYKASFLNVGAALQIKNSLIVEPTQSLGDDFIGCMKYTPISSVPTNTSAKDFYNQLVSRGILKENGEYSNFSVSGELARLLVENNKTLMFDTNLCEIKKTDNGYLCTLFSPDGFETVFAKKIVDSSNFGFLNQHRPKGQKAYSVLLSNEQVKSVAVNQTCDYSSAREEILIKVNSSEIASFASCFSFEFFEETYFEKDNYYWFPSAQYYNFLLSFEGGVEFGTSLFKK